MIDVYIEMDWDRKWPILLKETARRLLRQYAPAPEEPETPLIVYKNGMPMYVGIDYGVADLTVVFSSTPHNGENIFLDYWNSSKPRPKV